MKQTIRLAYIFTAGMILAFSLLLSCILANAQTPSATQTAPAPMSDQEKKLIAAFQERVKQYVKLRESVKDKLPKLSKDSTPEQITSHQKAFQDAVRASRASAKPGEIFTPDVADYFRTTIRKELKGSDRKEVRETVLEAETKGVPLRVNYAYPETKEVTEMPAKLLLRLPQLPKEVKYRFVRRHLLVVDTDNALIVDYLLDALP